MKHLSVMMASATTLLILSSCSSSDPAVPVVQTPAATTAFAPFAVSTGPTDVDATRESSIEAMDVLTEGDARQVMSAGSSLSQAEAGARHALAAASGLSPAGATALRQIVGSVMIHRHLETAEPDKEAVARYADILLTEQSPNAHLIARALPVLEPTWGADRVHRSATSAVSAARTYLDRTCPACNAQTLGRGQTPTGQTAAEGAVDQQRVIQDGISALEAMWPNSPDLAAPCCTRLWQGALVSARGGESKE